MTDYASQGKTRPVNVVNLTNSRSHQAYYTALSRSSSAAGTAIVSSFSTAMITRGLDDQLKREFRNLELLSEITRLKYEGKLPEGVTGETRNQLIRSFLDCVGVDYQIPNLHDALKWQSANEFDDIDAPFGRQPWQMVENEDKQTEKEDISTEQSTKRKRARVDDEHRGLGGETSESSVKRPRVESLKTCRSSSASSTAAADASTSPKGYEWDSANWSCPYDSLFTILYAIWSSNPMRWT
ncbi:hypothetical protein EV122DRAFT_192972, partial [Schizophyllum commune]